MAVAQGQLQRPLADADAAGGDVDAADLERVHHLREALAEAGRFCVEESLRIHGGYGYSKEYEIERLYRDAPLLLIGEGTSEIQRMVIGRKLLERHKI
ncbi:MAG TPA: acyl-CoA dehydrogenase family protein [Solirubrobacterales bacterium]|nr:acyl-CoA dehydrogenase family protein [Solirubrobacterales bacterium]